MTLNGHSRLEIGPAAEDAEPTEVWISMEEARKLVGGDIGDLALYKMQLKYGWESLKLPKLVRLSDVLKTPSPEMRRLNRKRSKVPYLSDLSPDDVALGQAITKARVSQGLSQRSLAEKVGVDQSTISRIESGISRKTDNVKGVKKALGL